ncbi:MAG: hypothetical protein IPM54_14090 [Polyangiaceae bacterium]|nr:hypothetical protein [Polyangiaceae bacterium]
MRFLSFLVVAAGVHLLIPVGARIAPRWDSLLVARSTGLAQRMLIEIEPLPEIELPNVPPESKPDQPREVATNDIVRRRTMVDPTAPPTPNTELSPSIPTDAVPPVTAGSGAPPDEYGSLPPGPSVPGIGTSGPIWAIPGVIPDAPKPKPAPTTIAAAPPTDPKLAGRLISDVVREKDRLLGLDLPGAGTIASVVSETVRGSNTPDFARATLEVRIAPSGRVTSVKVIRSSAGVMGDWTAVASTVQGRLSGRDFTLPSAFAAGAIVMVEVVSQLQMPDGTTSGKPTIQGGGSDSIGGSVNFDAANIGARPKRHVKAFASARPAT